MRKIVLYSFCIVMLVITIVTAMIIHGKNARMDEVQQGLDEAVEATISALFENRTYTVADEKEFAADFMQGLMANLNSTSDVTVNILKADKEKGLLSVEVVESYAHPGGRTGTVSCVRTVIFDTKKTDPQEECSVSYYLTPEDQAAGTEPYKRYTVKKDSSMPVPAAPEAPEGQRFAGWKDDAGNLTELSTMVADRDYSFVAVFTP